MPLIVHHHYHHHGKDSEQLSRIEAALRKQEIAMTALDDELASIKATQDATLATVASTKIGVESILAKLAAVPTAGLSPTQQSALDAIRDEGVTIAQNLSAVNTEANPAPAPAPAAPPAS